MLQHTYNNVTRVFCFIVLNNMIKLSSGMVDYYLVLGRESFSFKIKCIIKGAYTKVMQNIKMMKSKELLLMELFETNYLPRGGPGFTVDINVMNNQWHLVILEYPPTYECYVYVSTGNFIKGYHILLYFYEDTDFCNSN